MLLNNFFFLFIIGAVIGSFLNVCIYRLPKNLDIISKRSFCPRCKKKIKWFDNIPLISILILKFKCRFCKKSISIQYFLVELVSAVYLCLTLLFISNLIDLILLSLIFYIFIVIFVIDLKHYIIPDSLNFSLILLGIIKNFFPETSLNLNQDMFQTLIGCAIGYFLIWIIIFLYKKIKKIEAMGLGDAKLLSGFGLLFGLKSVFIILFTASIIGLAYSVPKLFIGKSTLKTAIPFGPFLIISAIVYYLCFSSL